MKSLQHARGVCLQADISGESKGKEKNGHSAAAVVVAGPSSTQALAGARDQLAPSFTEKGECKRNQTKRSLTRQTRGTG